jgi:DNA-binding CsgD family transcriptional regulator
VKVSVAAEIIGRDEELTSIRAFLDRVEDGLGGLVLSGEPGIGKTALWEEGVAISAGRFRVLSHRSAEAEASLSFTGLSDLLGPVFDEVASTLAPFRRRVLEVALLLAEPGGEAPDPRAIGLALLDVLRALAERGPIFVALDDIQWLDPSSATVLQLALRRLSSEPVRILATERRPSEAGPFMLEESTPTGRLTRLDLGPLSPGALHRLLKERIGLELTRPELIRVREASAGNPFFALELGRELARTNTRPAGGQPLPVPESLRDLLGGRLGRLPTETGDVVLFVAALARPTVELVAAAHGDRASVLEALELAGREGVVEFDEARLRFSHPLLASICYEQAPVWKRRAVHRALAAAVTDVEERARHLALSTEGPDAAVAASLEAASVQAAARGATAAAADLSELAAGLVPDDPARVRALRFRAAHFYRVGGDVERAVTTLLRLLEEVPHGFERADILFALAQSQAGGARVQIERSDEALIEAEGDDVRSARILAIRAGFHLLQADADAALADARASLQKAERSGDERVLAEAIAHAAHVERYRGEPTAGLVERAVEIEKVLGLQLEWSLSPSYALGRNLMRTGEIRGARSLFEEVEARSLERGDEVSRMMVLWPLAMVEWLAGRLQVAHERACEAYELTQQTQHAHARQWIGRAKALIEADLGLVGDARASAKEGLGYAEASSYELSVILTLAVLGRLELAQGNLEAAGNTLRELPGRLRAQELNDPTQPVWADTIETLIGMDELELARSYLESYEQNARRLDTPWVVASAGRCRGLLAAAEGNLAGALSSVEHARAVAGLEEFPLEQARTLLCQGTVLRQAQQKRSAREALRQALRIFEELSAPLWEEKASAELRRISGRRPSSEELTETEWRVAELAAYGRSNKEIAAELYMGVSTVEAHLSRVYRKLGVRRAGLARRLETLRAAGLKAVEEATQP